MQVQMNNVEVKDVPKFLARVLTVNTHAITILWPNQDDYIIPLSLKVVTSYFNTGKPTMQEYEQATTEIVPTYAAPEWDPHDTSFSQQDDAITDHQGEVCA